MPIYEYKCPNGHHFEVFHGMTDPSPERCEVCDAEPLVRVLHPVAVHYKGSGFYSTDYGKGGRKPKDGAGSSDSSSSSDGGKSSSDSGSSDSASSSPYNAEVTKKIKESGGGGSSSGSSGSSD